MHSGEIRICIEAGLPLSYLWRGAGARERALAQFGKLRVWDTEHNNGVLIYLLLAEHRIEIIADRGVSAHVDDSRWQAIVDRFVANVQRKRVASGFVQAIGECGEILAEAVPKNADNPNELPNRLIVIGYD